MDLGDACAQRVHGSGARPRGVVAKPPECDNIIMLRILKLLHKKKTFYNVFWWEQLPHLADACGRP